jgi:hypothetical protein
MRFWHAAAVLASAAAVVMSPAGNAAASTGAPFASPELAGYAVTGARFTTAETWVRLPNPAQFSGEVGRVAMSVQMQTSALIFDLSVTACTDASCRAGGKPLSQRYRLEFALYRRATRALVCSTAAPGNLRCPGVPTSWNRARIAPGQVAAMAISYPVPYDGVFLSVNDQGFGYFPVGVHSLFGQASIGVEFGTSPWASASFRAPRKAMAVASFDRPTPPPYAAEFATRGGSAGGIASWWADHQVRMTGGSSSRRVEAAPGGLFDDGYGFTVYLEP